MSDDPIHPRGGPRPSWKRIVFKPSGEALAGDSGKGLDGATLEATARDIVDLRQNLGVDVAVVVGGGNFWRGRTGSLSGMDATQSDHIGMLGTVMNALALQDALERLGQDTRVQSAIEMPRIAEAYIRRRAVRHLEKGRVVIFAAGTGNPFFTTDTAAALPRRRDRGRRRHQGHALRGRRCVLRRPAPDATATKYDEVGYLEVMTKNLKVMDATAIAFCRDNGIPIVVFDMSKPGSLRSIVQGGHEGTLVHEV